jgi:serine/threonine protein kinase
MDGDSPDVPAKAERLGRYEVIRHLASGGMADVMLARVSGTGIEGFERHVVLKRIRPEHAKDERFIRMFLDEARLAASLHHSNVVQVNDVGQDRGEYFFAMEYIHGADLRTVLHRVVRAKQQVPLAQVLAIGSAIAAGLHYAHEKKAPDGKPLGVVHRDVSLSNILIGFDGAVKLVDFGIAKAALRAQETRSGTLKGKVAYMSPEQCTGQPIDRRSDIWGIGVVLYETATASRLFTGDTDYMIMDAIVDSKIVSPGKRRADLPTSLSKIIMRALDQDPAKRFQTAGEMRQALDKLAAESNLVATATSMAEWLETLFGAAPEPWIGEGSSGFSGSFGMAKGTTATDRASLTDLHRHAAETVARRRGPSVDPLGDTSAHAEPLDRQSRRMAVADTLPPPVGFELPAAPSTRVRASRGQRAAIALGAAALVAGAIALALSGADDPSPAPMPAPTIAVAAATAPGTATATDSAAAAGSATAPAAAAGSDPAAGSAPAPAPAVATVARPTSTAADVDAFTRPRTKSPVDKGKKPPRTAPAPAPAPAPTPAPAPAPAPPPPAPVVVTPPPAPPAPTPAPPAEPTVIPISVVQRVAAQYEATLATKCESSETLKGEVTVRMHIDAEGKVVRTQVSSTIGKPKVSACIAAQVRTWRFPGRPGDGLATATYSVDFQ